MGVNRREVLKYGAQISTLLAMGSPAVAAADVPEVPFSLDFRVYGGNSPYFLGESSGIYQDSGVSLDIEGSSGSADSIRRVATGTADFGYADMSTLAVFTAQNPDAAPKLILPILDHAPASVMTIGGNKLSSLGDLKGKKVGIGANSAATKLMPALLDLNDIDREEINFVTVDVKIRDSLLLQGEVDAVIGYDYTSVFNFVDNGVDRDDIDILYFSEFGFDFPANSLIASQDMVANQPDLCKAVALGTAKAWRASYKDPKAAIDATVEREPLLNADVELQRLKFILETHIETENVRKNGIGYLDADRMEKGLSLIADGFNLDKKPEVSDFFVDKFLPQESVRKILS